MATSLLYFIPPESHWPIRTSGENLLASDDPITSHMMARNHRRRRSPSLTLHDPLDGRLSPPQPPERRKGSVVDPIDAKVVAEAPSPPIVATNAIIPMVARRCRGCRCLSSLSHRSNNPSVHCHSHYGDQGDLVVVPSSILLVSVGKRERKPVPSLFPTFFLFFSSERGC